MQLFSMNAQILRKFWVGLGSKEAISCERETESG